VLCSGTALAACPAVVDRLSIGKRLSRFVLYE
jgi:hypothetical protein